MYPNRQDVFVHKHVLGRNRVGRSKSFLQNFFPPDHARATPPAGGVPMLTVRFTSGNKCTKPETGSGFGINGALGRNRTYITTTARSHPIH